MVGTIIFDDHSSGRIYYLMLRRTTHLWYRPAWAENNYIQWDEKHGKYGLYRHVGRRSAEIPFQPGMWEALMPHDRVGAEPSFEAALDWLLGMSDSSRRSR